VKVAERMIDANGVELCTESFGRPADPPILLIMGIGASMLWWEEGFCRLLAEGGRFVIRYDHRDTGRSVTSEPGRPEYTSTDLIADSVGVTTSGSATKKAATSLISRLSVSQRHALIFALGSPARSRPKELPQASVPGPADLARARAR
jgi:pimeloyl-ACP methyl ester carboxylesterase